MTKVAIGKFYIAINHNLKEKGGRPGNMYRFTLIQSQIKQWFTLKITIKVKDMQLKQCTRQLEELNAECLKLKEQFKTSNDQLQAFKLAL